MLKYCMRMQGVGFLLLATLCVHRAQIKNFLDTLKPYFMYEELVQLIEDIASYHIHAGDYFL